MTEKSIKNFAESVRHRLLNQAKEQNVEFTHILTAQHWTLTYFLSETHPLNQCERFFLMS